MKNKLKEYAEEVAKTIINNIRAHTSYNYSDILLQEIAKFVKEHVALAQGRGLK